MARRLEAVKEMVIRYRFTLIDMVMIGAVLAAAIFGAWQYDVFPNETAIAKEHTFELDELFSIAALGFALFAWSRLRAQKREIIRRRVAEKQARTLALEDPLTGLPNRRQFEEAMQVALASMPGADAVHAIMMLDLNGFKKINDVYGHPTGDEALMLTAVRIRKAMREGDMVARFGGDEFAVLARHMAGADAAAGLASRIIEALHDPIVTGAGHHAIGSGIGIALMPADGTDAATLIRKADVALYRAKMKGRSAFRFFEEEMDQVVRERDRLEHDLRDAIGTPAIAVGYQPRIDLTTGHVKGFEAVPRWDHQVLGRLDTSRLFASGEAARLTRELMDDLLGHACREASHWPETVGLSFPLSRQILQDELFPLRLISTLNRSGLQPHRLELEIPESALVAELGAAQKVLGVLRDSGVKLAVTQFGTGYSSLYHLRSFPLDVIRIDRSFVQAMDHDPHSAAVVRALVGLGNGLGLTVAADGILRPDQRMTLASEGCSQGQGALFGDALDAEEAGRLIAERYAADPFLARQNRTAAAG